MIHNIGQVFKVRSRPGATHVTSEGNTEFGSFPRGRTPTRIFLNMNRHRLTGNFRSIQGFLPPRWETPSHCSCPDAVTRHCITQRCRVPKFLSPARLGRDRPLTTTVISRIIKCFCQESQRCVFPAEGFSKTLLKTLTCELLHQKQNSQ